MNGEPFLMSLKVGSFEKAGSSERMQQGSVTCLGEKDDLDKDDGVDEDRDVITGNQGQWFARKLLER